MAQMFHYGLMGRIWKALASWFQVTTEPKERWNRRGGHRIPSPDIFSPNPTSNPPSSMSTTSVASYPASTKEFGMGYEEKEGKTVKQLKVIVRKSRWIIRLDVKGALDKRTVAKVEESLVNLKLLKPTPLYINLSNANVSDSQGLMVLLEILCRLQDRYAYISFVDQSEKITAALYQLGAERILDRLVLGYPYQPVSCMA